MKKQILIALLLAILLVIGYFYHDDLFGVDDGDKKNSSTTNSTAVEKAPNLYKPNETIIDELTTLSDDLRMALMRGDAELAPGFEAFTETVADLTDSLNATIKKVEAEVAEKNIPETEAPIVNELKAIESNLRDALIRDESKFSPTYDEFYNMVYNAQKAIERILLTFQTEAVEK
jgi:hypothetical protein